MFSVAELRQKRANLVHEARKILETAEAEGRDLTAEEQEKFDRMMADVDALKEKIERMERIITLEQELNKSAGRRSEPQQPSSEPDREERRNPFASPEYRKALLRYARVGVNGLLPEELRALQIGTDSEGGYLVAQEFEKKIVETLDAMNVMRRLATIIQTGGDRNVPVESSTGTAYYTAEENAFTESDHAFGQVTLGAYKLATIMKVSEELLQDAVFDLETYIAKGFGRRLARRSEQAFIAGTGTGEPTGIVNAVTAGVTAAATNAITADELIDLYHALSSPYRANAVFLANDSTVAAIRKLKDSNNQYVWQPGLQAGQPDRLLGKPLYTSPYMPELEADKVTIVFGDLSYYWIAERGKRVFQRLSELYAANGQVGFRMWERHDGNLVLSEAVTALKQAAA